MEIEKIVNKNNIKNQFRLNLINVGKNEFHTYHINNKALGI